IIYLLSFILLCSLLFFLFFFFNDTATTAIYTLSLHDALPILVQLLEQRLGVPLFERKANRLALTAGGRVYQAGLTQIFDQLSNLDRKSTRLNSSHDQISYAVFCLKKKKKNKKKTT